MNKSFAAILLNASLPLLLAQSAPPEGPVRSTPPKPQVSGEGGCIPMSVRGVQPSIPVRVGDRELTVIFDTGAPGGPHMSEGMLASLGSQKIGEAMVSDPSLQNPKRAGVYRVDNLRIGNLVVDNWQAVGREDSGPVHEGLDGVIGPGAFDGFIVTLDFPSGRMLIEKGRLPEADGKNRFQYDGTIPQVPLTIDGKTIPAHIDTGNGRYPIILPREFAESLPRADESFAVGIARTVNNSFSLKALPLGEARVGEVPLYAGTAAWPAPARMGNIGSPLLRDFVVRIDTTNDIVELAHAVEAADGCPAS